MTLVDIPITFITIGLYTLIVYFIVGLQRSAGQFLYVSSLLLITLVSDVFGCLFSNSVFFLFIFTVTMAMKSFFRGLAAAFTTGAPAQAIAGIMLLALSLYTGYNIPIPSMIGALRWISYINVRLSIHRTGIIT